MNTNTDDFDALFNSPEVPVKETGLPETEAEKPTPTKKRLSLAVKAGIAVAVFVVLVFILMAVFGSSGKKQTVQDLPQMAPVKTQAPQFDLTAENERLNALLEQAKSSVAVRDQKYLQLKTFSDAQGEEIVLLKKMLDEKQPPEKAVKSDVRQDLPQLKGVSLHSIYKGFAFIKKGDKVFSVTPGELVNGAKVIEIDPVIRLVVTTNGVIK